MTRSDRVLLPSMDAEITPGAPRALNVFSGGLRSPRHLRPGLVHRQCVHSWRFPHRCSKGHHCKRRNTEFLELTTTSNLNSPPTQGQTILRCRRPHCGWLVCGDMPWCTCFLKSTTMEQQGQNPSGRSSPLAWCGGRGGHFWKLQVWEQRWQRNHHKRPFPSSVSSRDRLLEKEQSIGLAWVLELSKEGDVAMAEPCTQLDASSSHACASTPFLHCCPLCAGQSPAAETDPAPWLSMSSLTTAPC